MADVATLQQWERRTEARAAVVAIGNFDGVHRAHQQLLAAVREDARAHKAVAVAITFEPHPARILRPGEAPRLLTPGGEKARLLAAAGAEAVVTIPFTRDLSLWTPREFVERVLVRGVRALAVHEGENFRFGHRHEGDVAALRRFGDEYGFQVTIHPEVTVRGEIASSSRIRARLAAGEVGRARGLLGRPFQVCGPIAPGRGVGRQRTVPTLNLQHYEEMLPATGVYLTRVEVEGHWFAALTNIGVRPTFGEGGPLTVESHLLHPPAAGIAAGLGDGIRIAFLRHLRAERRFDTPEALRAQIQADIGFAEQYFRRLDSICKGEVL